MRNDYSWLVVCLTLVAAIVSTGMAPVTFAAASIMFFMYLIASEK